MTTIDWTTDTKGTGQYAEVNGINLYYETIGTGRPLILLTAGWDRVRCSDLFVPLSPRAISSSSRTCKATAVLPTSIDRSTSG